MWRKLPNPNPLTIGLDTWVEDSRLHVEHVHKHNQWNLIIEHVTSADQGDYECQVSMKERSLRKNIQLEVIGESKLQALVYDILLSTTAVFSYAIGSRKTVS